MSIVSSRHVPAVGEVPVPLLGPDGQPCLRIGFAAIMGFVTPPPANTVLTELTGPIIDVVELVLNKIGRCFYISRSEDFNFGTVLPNGTGTELLGRMQRHEYDIFAGLFTVDLKSKAILEFSEPLVYSSPVIIWRHPTPEPNVKGFIQTFDYLVWSLILASLFVMMAALPLFSVLSFSESDKSVKSTGRKDFKSERDRWSMVNDAVLDTLALLLSQGAALRWNFNRTLLLTWLLAVFIIQSVYRSDLMALLIMPILKRPFTTVEQFLLPQFDHFRVYTVIGSELTDEIMSLPPNHPFYKLKERAILITRQEGRVLIYNLEHPAAYQKELITALISTIFTSTATCPYYLTEPFMTGHTMGMAFPKPSPYTKIFTRTFLRLKEVGLWTKMVEPWFRNASFCMKLTDNTGPSDNTRVLQLKDFYGSFALLFAGLGLSTLIFAFELLAKKLNCVVLKKAGHSGEMFAVPENNAPP